MSKKPKEVVGSVDRAESVADRVFVSIGRTVALPKYESFRVEYGEGMAVRPGQDRDRVGALLTSRVLERLSEIIELAKEELT